MDIETKLSAAVVKLAGLMKEPKSTDERWRGYFFLHVKELANLMGCDLVPRKKSEYKEATKAPAAQPMSQVDMAAALRAALGGKKRK